ncbi:MAG: T9SS type A sorting domain-containing protein [Balneolaceae bacterium]|nr:T9SS type A sorting domain-containing protein [Balneolaceae bacterium]
MKINKLIALLGLLLIPAMASAQWAHDTTFVPMGDDLFLEVHGVAVDGEGKIWIQPFSATETIVTNRDLGDDGVPDTLSTRVVYVYNADGTPASFSPLKVITYADDTPADTLGRVWTGDSYVGYSGRGIEADYNGDIIISQFNRLYKVNHVTGQGIAKADVPDVCAITEASTDAANNIYVGAVCAADTPIWKYDSNLENPEQVITLGSSFSRDLQVSADGNTIWWAGYTLGAVLKYTRPDEFSGFDATPDTVLRGMKSESFDIHPVTGYLWAGSGSLNDVPNAPYQPQTWYAFDPADIGTDNEAPLDSIRWAAGADVAAGFDNARPRGLDFSADGKTAYVGAFSAAETTVDLQKFTTDQVFISNEEENISGIPAGYSLEQNYPNPFNPSTNIQFTINEPGAVTLKVYDMTGREVASILDGRMNAGEHTVRFDASALSSGVYIYVMQSNGVRLTNKMTLIK